MRTAKSIRYRDNVHPGFGVSPAAVAHKFIRADIDQLARMPMIGIVNHDYVLMACVCACQTQGQFVGFRARIEEEHGIEFLR